MKRRRPVISSFAQAHHGGALKVLCEVVDGDKTLWTPFTDVECFAYRTHLVSRREYVTDFEFEDSEQVPLRVVADGIRVELAEYWFRGKARKLPDWESLRPHLGRIDALMEAHGRFAGSLSRKSYAEETTIRLGQHVTVVGTAHVVHAADGYRGATRLTVRDATLLL